ncbi:MAG: hypothetical protein ACLRXC_04090 [[Clostridium] leptum]
MADLVILGGGASGLMAAVSAARLFPEKYFHFGAWPGRQKAAGYRQRTRNLTNLELDFSRYHGAPESFVSLFSLSFRPRHTLLFGRLGLLYREEGQGSCYPYGQASAVLDVLRSI